MKRKEEEEEVERTGKVREGRGKNNREGRSRKERIRNKGIGGWDFSSGSD